MKPIIKFFVLVVFSLFHLSSFSYEGIEGKWNILDPKTEATISVIYISLSDQKVAGKAMTGKLIRLYYSDISKAMPLCDKCKGELKSRALVGMDVIKDLLINKNGKGKAKILNPDNGMWYKVKVKVSDDEKRLIFTNGLLKKISGGAYKGSELLGKSTELHRAR